MNELLNEATTVQAATPEAAFADLLTAYREQLIARSVLVEVPSLAAMVSGTSRGELETSLRGAVTIYEEVKAKLLQAPPLAPAINLPRGEAAPRVGQPPLSPNLKIAQALLRSH